MLHAHTVDQVRAAEADLMALVPDGALMQRAAVGLAHAVIDFLGGAYGRRVVLLVGSGDNGGDALHAGAHLARRGAQVEARLLSDRAHAGGLAALKSAGGRVSNRGLWPHESGVLAPPEGQNPRLVGPQTPIRRWDVVIDGIVGIGGRGGLREDAVAALDALAGVPVVAVDTPSGVDVDTGEVNGPHVSADLTVTFGTHKPCHLLDPGALACGTVHLVDIGLEPPRAPIEALQPEDVAALVPRPAPDDHKYTRGVVGIRAGSDRYPGAALLSVAGAASGLAGMVRYVGPDPVADRIRAAHPEVVGAGRVQAWVVGSGSAEEAEDGLRDALTDDVPLVVDADGLEHLDLVRGANAVLTPHAGELARMLAVAREEVEARPLHHARYAAADTGAVVLLKGRRTVIAAPDGATRVTLAGTPWLGTAGAGDVLGGLIGSLLAGGLTPYDAASVGSWLHGAAATVASHGGPLVAGDVARALPAVVADLAVKGSGAWTSGQSGARSSSTSRRSEPTRECCAPPRACP